MAAPRTHLVCIGDSLTQGVGVEPGSAWPGLLGSRLARAGVRVSNRGIGGDNTAGMLGRMREDVLALSPTHVLVTGGTNDVWFGADPGGALSNLWAFVRRLEFYGLIPVVGVPIPLDLTQVDEAAPDAPPGGFQACAARVDQVAEAIATLARGNRLAHVDFRSCFRDEGGGVVSASYLSDGVHPNGAGHQAMADAAERSLRRIL